MQSYRSGSKTLHNLTLESLQEKTKTFCGTMGSNQYWAGRVYDMCVYHMTGTPEVSPKVVLWRSRESNLGPLVYKT